MSEATRPAVKKRAPSTLGRVARYVAVRMVVLFVTVVVGVYLTILIANMGGHVDKIRKAEIRVGIATFVALDPQVRQMPPEARNELISDLIAVEEHRLGLDQPFLVRSVGFLQNALTLNLGRADQLTSDSGSKLVRNIILERLPPTLLLMATSNLLLFFVSLFFGLSLARHYGSWLDRVVIALSPTSAGPAWFYGLILIVIFAGMLGVLPWGGMVSAPPPDNKLTYALSLAEHLVLPIGAWMMSAIFQTAFGWRTFFLIFSMEDYVEMARAKGLSKQAVERGYILRPTLPNIITRFALMLIGLWAGAILLETVFNWPGLGRLFYQAIGLYDTPVIVGNTVIYAYLLALTVFLLDFIYALVDPRVRVGS
ncbi:MAG TPA: ABC transporter permease [Anaerolineae bacterium]|nr:ABC transporter permease [Anaerolineae bacterium]HPL29484.1 ABC transporter permease [Anaerolineae bacterium]